MTDRLVELNRQIEELSGRDDPSLDDEISVLDHEAAAIIRERFEATHKPIVLAVERAEAKARELLYGEKSVRWLGVTTYFPGEYPESFGLYRWPFRVDAEVKPGEPPRAELWFNGETLCVATGDTLDAVAEQIDRAVAAAVKGNPDRTLRHYHD